MSFFASSSASTPIDYSNWWSKSYEVEAIHSAYPEFKEGITAINNYGDTIVHYMARISDDHKISLCILPSLLKQAEQECFNFRTKGFKGLNILHITAIEPGYVRDGFPSVRDNVARVLENAPSSISAINELSDSGSTPLYYAINHLHLNSARTLLSYGADPTLCGADPSRNPMVELDRIIAEFTKAIPECEKEIAECRENFSTLIIDGNLQSEHEQQELLESVGIHATFHDRTSSYTLDDSMAELKRAVNLEDFKEYGDPEEVGEFLKQQEIQTKLYSLTEKTSLLYTHLEILKDLKKDIEIIACQRKTAFGPGIFTPKDTTPCDPSRTAIVPYVPPPSLGRS